MEDLVKVVKLKFTKNDKIYVVSDIHGNYHLLEKILQKNDFKLEEDYLLILGDLSAKGPMPLKTLRYIINLSKKKKVHVIMGNCDEADILLLEAENFEYFVNNLKKPVSLFHDMLNELRSKNPTVNYPENELPQIFRSYFKEEFDFIENLPHVIDTDEYIFVHAGIPFEMNYEKDSYKLYVRGRKFYKNGHNLQKMVICGHMPTTIFRKNEFNDNILFDKEKRMILIDGGLMVQDGGQLNLLCIDKSEDMVYQVDTIDDLTETLVLERQTQTIKAKGTCWPNYQITPLSKKDYFTKCLLNETKEVAEIKNEYISSDHTFTINDCPASLIDVKKGDIVKIVNDTTLGYTLVKKEGILGWIKKDFLGGKR